MTLLVTAPCPDPLLTAHCDIEYSEILPSVPERMEIKLKNLKDFKN